MSPAIAGYNAHRPVPNARPDALVDPHLLLSVRMKLTDGEIDLLYALIERGGEVLADQDENQTRWERLLAAGYVNKLAQSGTQIYAITHSGRDQLG